MTPLRTKPVLLLSFAAVLVLSGCAARKKPVLVVPQEQPPVAAATPAPTPAASPQSESTQPATQSTDTAKTDTAETSPTDKAAKPKERRQRGAIKKPSPSLRAENTPSPEPKGTPEPRSTPAPIAPSVSANDAARDRTSTDQLLQITESNLNGIKRQLTKDEEAMVAQIRNYMNQSRQATKDNDPARAHTLAMKANLLSNELVRR
jgi:outer membrane biosynthesis protein TonB